VGYAKGREDIVDISEIKLKTAAHPRKLYTCFGDKTVQILVLASVSYTNLVIVEFFASFLRCKMSHDAQKGGGL
jgi:hypothetical protein